VHEYVKGAGSDRAVCGGGGGVDEEGVEPEKAEEGLRRGRALSRHARGRRGAGGTQEERRTTVAPGSCRQCWEGVGR
jgi:hypothetical protein